MDALSMTEALESALPLRDLFAMVALNGAFRTDSTIFSHRSTEVLEDITRDAYRWADAMLKAREQK